MIYHVVPGPLHGFMNELNLTRVELNTRVVYVVDAGSVTLFRNKLHTSCTNVE